MLGVALLQIAETADELFARDFFAVGNEVALGGLSGVVNEDVRISGHTSNSTDHVTAIRISSLCITPHLNYPEEHAYSFNV